MIRVGIVEDSEALRKSLVNLINYAEGMQCTVALSNLLNVVSDLRINTPDVVLMDVGLPDISGIEGVITIKENFPSVQLLMFTVFDDDEKIFQAIQAGASGYLLKSAPPSEIIEAIYSLYHGGAPMTPSIARRVIESFHDHAPGPKEAFSLTTRESEILHSLVKGLSYKKLAEKYFISISTVRTHIQHIYEKLHVNSKAEAVARVLKKPGNYGLPE